MGETAPEFTDDEWFRGMAVAAFTMSIVTLQVLYADETFDRARLTEIMDGALQVVEGQGAQVKRSENIRASQAARFHLERAAAETHGKADEIDARRAAGSRRRRR